MFPATIDDCSTIPLNSIQPMFLEHVLGASYDSRLHTSSQPRCPAGEDREKQGDGGLGQSTTWVLVQSGGPGLKTRQSFQVKVCSDTWALCWASKQMEKQNLKLRARARVLTPD